jgi:hypothetical protein
MLSIAHLLESRMLKTIYPTSLPFETFPARANRTSQQIPMRFRRRSMAKLCVL